MVRMFNPQMLRRDRRQTALFFAVYNDSEEATEMLLDAGADTELDYVKVYLWRSENLLWLINYSHRLSGWSLHTSSKNVKLKQVMRFSVLSALQQSEKLESRCFQRKMDDSCVMQICLAMADCFVWDITGNRHIRRLVGATRSKAISLSEKRGRRFSATCATQCITPTPSVHHTHHRRIQDFFRGGLKEELIRMCTDCIAVKTQLAR